GAFRCTQAAFVARTRIDDDDSVLLALVQGVLVPVPLARRHAAAACEVILADGDARSVGAVIAEPGHIEKVPVRPLAGALVFLPNRSPFHRLAGFLGHRMQVLGADRIRIDLIPVEVPRTAVVAHPVGNLTSQLHPSLGPPLAGLGFAPYVAEHLGAGMVKTVSATGDGASLTPDTFIEVDHHSELSLTHGTASLILFADVNETRSFVRRRWPAIRTHPVAPRRVIAPERDAPQAGVLTGIRLEHFTSPVIRNSKN